MYEKTLKDSDILWPSLGALGFRGLKIKRSRVFHCWAHLEMLGKLLIPCCLLCSDEFQVKMKVVSEWHKLHTYLHEVCTLFVQGLLK